MGETTSGKGAGGRARPGSRDDRLGTQGREPEAGGSGADAPGEREPDLGEPGAAEPEGGAEPGAAGPDAVGQEGGPLGPAERRAFRRRLARLDERLEAVRDRNGARGGRPGDGDEMGGVRGKGVGYALRMSIDMVAALVVGGAMGWYLDRWFGTRPVLLLLFGALGVAAGFSNVARTYRQMRAEMAPRDGQEDARGAGPGNGPGEGERDA